MHFSFIFTPQNHPYKSQTVLDCKCYPKLSYFFHDWSIANPDTHFLNQLNTYGVLLGIGSIVFVWFSARYLQWNFIKFMKYVFIPFCVAFCGNVIVNTVFGSHPWALSTTPFLCSYLIYTAIVRIPKPLFLILLISVGITKLGCHFSGDGDWGKTVAQDSMLYEFLKDCKHAHNVINIGESINGSSLDFNKQLSEPKYPLPLVDAILFTLIAAVSFSFKRIKLEIAGILFCSYSIISSGMSQQPFETKGLIFYTITMLFLFVWMVVKSRGKDTANQNSNY